MGKEKSFDYIGVLNKTLKFYYDNNDSFPIKTEINKTIDLPLFDTLAALKTLTEDGYVEHGNLFLSKKTVCNITGKGRVFHEQGGYQNNITEFDKLIKWTKNNKIYAWSLFGFIIAAALVGLGVSIITIVEFFQKQ